MTEKAISTAKGLGPWAGLLGMVVIAVFQFWGTHGAEAQQTKQNTADIQRLDDNKADRREVEDLKQWMKRVNDNLDRLNDKMDRRR